PRVNSVSDETLLKRLEQPAVAFRNRRVIDAVAGGLDAIEIHRGTETIALRQGTDGWKLTAPASADADPAKTSPLASNLAGVEAVEFITSTPKDEDLDKLYGLAKPELSVKVTFSDPAKLPQSLEVGKQRPGKDDFFARIQGAPEVFVIKKVVRDQIDQNSLAF